MFFFFSLLLFHDQIKVDKSSVFALSFENYEKNFEFIVNNKKYQTSRIIADILSPKINRLHKNNPNTTSFTIRTRNKGNFQFFLNLISFNFNEIPEEEIPFIDEIISILETQFVETINDNEKELTIDSAINNIFKHEKCKNYYFKQIKKEIDFIATHFYMMNENDQNSICSLKKFILDQIFNHTHLSLRNEDQLLNTINNIYKHNSNYSYMYEYVEFDKVSKQSINNFLEFYNHNDLTPVVWRKISELLKQNDNKSSIKKHHYYEKTFMYKNDNKLNGIINYLRKQSKDINNEISITYSSVNDQNSHSILDFDDAKNNFKTKPIKKSWICLEFKNHLIIPFNYSIRINKVPDVDNLKSWVIEGSNDGKNWFLIDERNDFRSFWIYTFKVKNTSKSIKYLRLRMTDKSWQDRSILEINAIELYGILI